MKIKTIDCYWCRRQGYSSIVYQQALSRLFIPKGDNVFPLCIKRASLAFLAASPVASYEFKWDLEEGWVPRGGDTPLYKPYRYVPP